jgi:hypothetical protein
MRHLFFKTPEQLIKAETPDSLVLARLNRLKVWGGFSLILALVTGVATLFVGLNLIGGLATVLYVGLGLVLLASDQTITIAKAGQQLFFSTRFGPIERRTRDIPLSDIGSVYLDYEEHVYPNVDHEEQVERKWFIYLVLNNRQTVTLAFYRATYPVGLAPNLAKQTAAWENLAQKICQATDKLLIRTPTVPGHAPRTFVEVIDQLVQRRLAGLPSTDSLAKRTIRLRSHPNGTLEVVVDGAVYRELHDIKEEPVRNLVQGAVDEWQALHRRDGSFISINNSQANK